MSWVVLETDGSIAAILNDHPGVTEARRVVELDVPPEYPASLEWDAEGEQFVPSPQKAMDHLRTERNARLAACDYPPLFERPEAEQPAWRAYRQALRDMPDTADPFAPDWPAPPTITSGSPE